MANFNPVKNEPGESDWAELKEAQLKTLAVPNTGMAVSIDIGEANDIHPKNRQDVGTRLALIARSKYMAIAYRGPVCKSSKVEGKIIRLSFNNTEGGLMAKENEELKGFAVAGADKIYHWADAHIEGSYIMVSIPQVASPVAVRYAWANNHVCMYNKAGLPASPFRTDDWQIITRK